MTKGKKTLIETLLDLEDEVRDAADEYPAGDNSDAVKYALTQVAQRIGALRNALDSNERLARDVDV